MPKVINGKNYYPTTEVCRKTNISTGTLYRRIRHCVVPEAQLNDRNGWRLFLEGEAQKIRKAK